MFDKEYLPLSAKNIPILSKRSYIHKLVQSINKFHINVRWKAYHFDQNTNKKSTTKKLVQHAETIKIGLPVNCNSEQKKLQRTAAKFYRLKTNQHPMFNPELEHFENMIIDLVKNTRKINNFAKKKSVKVHIYLFQPIKPKTIIN